jgi:Domain of unknown function (DUF4160)
MPRISAFYGVVIYMYWNERDHPVAHFHAYHAGRRASVAVDGTVLAGSLECRAALRTGMGQAPERGNHSELGPRQEKRDPAQHPAAAVA